MWSDIQEMRSSCMKNVCRQKRNLHEFKNSNNRTGLFRPRQTVGPKHIYSFCIKRPSVNTRIWISYILRFSPAEHPFVYFLCWNHCRIIYKKTWEVLDTEATKLQMYYNTLHYWSITNPPTQCNLLISGC